MEAHRKSLFYGFQTKELINSARLSSVSSALLDSVLLDSVLLDSIFASSVGYLVFNL
jgi:hypothetical protein